MRNLQERKLVRLALEKEKSNAILVMEEEEKPVLIVVELDEDLAANVITVAVK